MKYSFLPIFVFLIACSKSEPIKVTKSLNQYVGVWQTLYKLQTKNSLDIRNILLVINADSTAVYRQCIISKTASENSSSRSSVRNVSMLNAIIIGLTNNEITLEQETENLFIGTFFINYDLPITRVPYLENDRWYMEIDNTLLRKLDGDEISTKTTWECPKMDD